ncbi:MAG: hypothetical protein QOI77_928 [Blastocatellia bacterium]|nr:hypothetical protein [Blastocatellia bacterium]
MLSCAQIARSFGPRRKLKRESGLQHLIAVMAQVLDQDTTKALTLTAQWQSYLESRRQMEHTRKDVEKLVERMKKSDDV